MRDFALNNSGPLKEDNRATEEAAMVEGETEPWWCCDR